MGFLPQIPVLHGALVRLEPLAVTHAADLAVAAEEDRGSYDFTVVPRAGQLDEYLAGHARRVADGITAYWGPRLRPGRPGPPGRLRAIDIGWTWLAASAQRTGINLEAKLLLCEYAFETLGVDRVGFSTDARNERSRHALAGLGARFEGVLRRWSPSWAPGEEGLARDSAIFSVIAPEWPATKAGLRRRLAHAAPGP
jgi:N-acetyltransferase